jgi:hypothetical protein
MSLKWGSAVLGVGSVLTGVGLSMPAKIGKPPQADALKDGLSAWRTPGKIAGAACADCHGPDGLELAIYNFDDADLRRRATPHLETPDVERIVGLIHAVREKYRISKLLDPLKDRPFQPGGEVLPGATPAERDLAFGRELQGKLPHLLKGRIESIDQAKTAAEEMMAVDPLRLKIGLPFNRFSEDAFHGKEHASLAHWVPDIARIIPAQNRLAWYALQDAYLANPTDDALWKLYNAIDSLTKPATNMAFAIFAAEKYRSLLLMQHIARRRMLGDDESRGPVTFGALTTPMAPNPMWRVGELAREFMTSNPASMGLDKSVEAKKSGGPTFQEQMIDLQASWFWLGWLFDQGLHRTSFRPMIARGDWLAVAMWNAGPYPIHNVFWDARKQLVATRVPDAWKWLPDRRQPEWDYLAIRIGGGYEEHAPQEPAHRAIYERFVTNCIRMSLYLMLDEWRTSKVVWLRKAATDDVKSLTLFLSTHDPAGPVNLDPLRDALYAAIAACQEKT